MAAGTAIGLAAITAVAKRKARRFIEGLLGRGIGASFIVVSDMSGFRVLGGGRSFRERFRARTNSYRSE